MHHVNMPLINTTSLCTQTYIIVLLVYTIICSTLFSVVCSNVPYNHLPVCFYCLVSLLNLIILLAEPLGECTFSLFGVLYTVINQIYPFDVCCVIAHYHLFILIQLLYCMYQFIERCVYLVHALYCNTNTVQYILCVVTW